MCYFLCNHCGYVLTIILRAAEFIPKQPSIFKAAVEFDPRPVDVSGDLVPDVPLEAPPLVHQSCESTCRTCQGKELGLEPRGLLLVMLKLA